MKIFVVLLSQPCRFVSRVKSVKFADCRSSSTGSVIVKVIAMTLPFSGEEREEMSGCSVATSSCK